MVSATSPDPDQTVELISMYVAPFARGQGVGDALIQSVIQWAKERRARRLILDVVDGNRHAIALYRRHGFADEGFIEECCAGSPAERRMSYALM